MKKKMMIFICLIFFMPLIVLAYSKEVILGGATLGIEIKNDGILIVGFYKVNGNYINQQLKIGDKIKEIAGKKVNDVNHMVELIDKNMKDSKVIVLISRDNILMGHIELVCMLKVILQELEHLRILIHRQIYMEPWVIL